MTHNDDEPMKGQQLPPFAEPERSAAEEKKPKPRPSLHHSRKRKPRLDETIIAALPAACADEQKAVEFIESMRWGAAPRCPRCASYEVKKMTAPDGTRNKRFLWRCYGCKKLKQLEQFTVRIGTVYEESRLPMRVWTTAMWMTSSAKNGCSALELARVTHCTHKSALFVLHRLRAAMATDWSPEPKLRGSVVVDETYVGPHAGRGRRSLKDRKRRGNLGTDWSKKRAVIAMIHQGTGEVRTHVTGSVNKKDMGALLRRNIAIENSMLLTDTDPTYKGLGKTFGKGHRKVNHSIEEYVRYDDDGVVVTTNPCEAFFSRLKRAIVGTFHSISVKHAHRYASQFEFMSNTSKMSDGARLMTLIRKANGKRLTYRDQVG